MEIAAAGRSRGVRHLPLQHDAPRARARVRLGNGGQERRGVRVLGSPEELVGRRQLHDAPDVHHGHAVADVAHHAQVVRHEEVGQPELGLQIQQQVQDLGLHRDVQGRDRLIGDHQARVQGQRAGDADALALAAAEGMREAPHVLGPEPDAAQEIRHALFTLAAGSSCRGPAAARPTRSSSVMRGLSDENGSWKIICISRRSARSSAGRSRPISITEPPATRMKISPAVGSMARRMHRAGGGLPAAALADQAQRLPLVDVKVDAVHRADVAHRPLPEALPDRKELLQPGDPQQGLLGQGGRLRIPAWLVIRAIAGAPLTRRGNSSRRAGRRPAASPAPGGHRCRA